jgi:hypothetical protein
VIRGTAQTRLSAWPNGLNRAPFGFTVSMSRIGPGSNPRAGTAKQAVHPSGVGKLVYNDQYTADVHW